MNFSHRQKKRTIKIAGAGPAGLAAAIHLARAGYAVEIFEARSTVGGRFINDFQTIENASRPEDAVDMLARIGIEKNFFFKAIYRAEFYDHRLKSQTVKSELPFAYFIRRGPGEGTLDRGLLAQAMEIGVQIHYRTRAKAEAVDIVATGPAVPDGLAKEMTFSSSHDNTVSVLFDMDIAPGAYSYLFIIDGKGTFGCAVTRGFDRINDYFDRALKRFQEISAFETKDEKTGYSFMNFCLKKSAKSGGRLYVGEVAGFQDYLFGLGIRYALSTGFAAAESIIQNLDYDVLWKKEVGPGQEVGLVNRFFYELGGNAGLSTFIKRAGRQDLRLYLKKWHRLDRWKALLLPLLKRAWRQNDACRHRIPEHWCRKKTEVSSEMELGPIVNES